MDAIARLPTTPSVDRRAGNGTPSIIGKNATFPVKCCFSRNRQLPSILGRPRAGPSLMHGCPPYLAAMATSRPLQTSEIDALLNSFDGFDKVAIQNEREPPRAILAVAGAKRDKANGCFLTPKFVYRAHAGAFRENRLQGTNLGVVRRDHHDIFRAEAPGPPRTPSRAQIGRGARPGRFSKGRKGQAGHRSLAGGARRKPRARS